MNIPKFTLIHPTKNRLAKSQATLQKWIDKSSYKMKHSWIEVIVSLDHDDPNIATYQKGWSNYGHSVCVNQNRSAVDAINKAAQRSKGNILIVVSDDTDCPDHWDESLLNEMGDNKDFILKTQDGIQPWIITMPVMDRAYYNRFRYIYYPEYQHMFCDTELTCVADMTGKKQVSALKFQHNHYSVTKGQPDAINKKADATWAQGEKLFLERYKLNFNMPKGGPQIQDKGMIQWLQNKAR